MSDDFATSYICTCMSDQSGVIMVAIPRARYEALMALQPIVAELAYTRAPLNDRVYREARDKIAALRSAGIDLEDKT